RIAGSAERSGAVFSAPRPTGAPPISMNGTSTSRPASSAAGAGGAARTVGSARPITGRPSRGLPASRIRAIVVLSLSRRGASTVAVIGSAGPGPVHQLHRLAGRVVHVGLGRPARGRREAGGVRRGLDLIVLRCVGVGQPRL